MKRMFFVTISLLMALTIIRSIIGTDEPMTLTRFLRTLSEVKISFENTLEQILQFRNSLTFPEMPDSNLFEQASVFFKWIYQLFKNLLFVPIEILHDLLNFMASVLGFLQSLLV